MNDQQSFQNSIKLWRLIVFLAVVAFVFIIFILRLVTLQLLQHDQWVAIAAENSTRTLNIPSLRGIILDRNDVVLARNVPSYNVVITAADLPDDVGEVQEIFRQLSDLINVPVNRNEVTPENPYVPCISDHGISQIAEYGASSTPYDPVRVKCDIDETIAKIIEERSVDWPGVSIEVQPLREYPTGSLTAPFIGFLGPIPANQEDYFKEKGLVPNRDKVGYAGLELQYQDLLAGENGKRVVQVDVGGKVLKDIEPPIETKPGESIRLTIDTRLQEAAEEILKKEIREWNAYFGEIRYSSGVVIAIKPKTGEILAMVSYPSYENNRMSRFIPAYYYKQLIEDPANPLLNHAVGDVLPAGSVFKLVTGTGALNEGVVTPDQVIETPPKIVVTEKYYANDPGKAREFVDWNKAGFGHLNFIGGLANSSNVYFYKLGGGYKNEVPNGGLGICRLGTYAAALGYGDAPGIGLPDEEDGLIPSPTWKRVNHAESWSSGDTYIASVGQGYVLATPIQVLISAAIIANDGKYMQPVIVKDIIDNEGNVVQPFTPKVKWDITQDPVIQEFGEATIRGCEPIEGKKKTVQPWVVETVQEGMRAAVVRGTLKKVFKDATFSAAGKTGTAEYCDKYAQARHLCIPGNWPAHAWTVAYAPYENPEIAVVAFIYNGNEGSTVAGPIVRGVLEAYLKIKAAETTLPTP